MRLRELRGSLQLEIVASLFVVMLAGLALVAVVMGTLATQTVERESIDRLRAGAHHLKRLLATGSGRFSDMAAVTHTLDPRALGVRWSVIDGAGRELVPGGRPRSAEGARIELLEAAWREGADVIAGGGFPPRALVIAVPIADAAGGRGALVGVIPAEALRARLGPPLRSGAWVLAIAALVFVVFGTYLLRRRIVLPLQELSDASRRIGEGDLDVCVSSTGADELAELACRFGEMASSLQRQREALVEAQRLLSRSERLASVGRLAAGVAHEVGNPVAAILGYAAVARRTPELPRRTRDTIDRIREEALRVRALVRELLDLARADDLELERCECDRLVRGVVDRIAPQPLLEGIALEVEVEPGLPGLEVDVRRVEQVLVNLIENAAHASRVGESPRIEVRARRAHLRQHAQRRKGDPPLRGFEGARRPDAVAIDVIDNGPGIDPADLPHVFDPFFTTKDPGSGTGLGLWNGHRFAELLGGSLEAESRPGRTAFSLILPATDNGGWDGSTPGSDHR